MVSREKGPIRIGFVTDYFWPHIGGMETWTLEVSKVLAQEGHEVVVYTHTTREHRTDENVEGIKVRRFGPRVTASLFSDYAPYPYLVRALLLLTCLPVRLLSDRDFDVLIITYVPLMFLGRFARLLGFRVWGVIHGYYDSQSAFAHKGSLRGFLMIMAQMLCLRTPVEGFLVVGNEVKRAIERGGVRGERIRVVRGGANLREIRKVEAKKAPRPQICFISRMTPERRLDDLIRAFLLVKAEIPSARLVVMGEGPLRVSWENLVESLHLEDTIKFVGALSGDAKIRILKESHVLVHPSLREGMSLSIVESLACSTPVIAYDIPEVREQLAFTGGGILVKPRDTIALANAVISLLRDPDRLKHFASQGRLSVEKSLAWEKTGHQVLRAVTKNVQS